MYEVDFTCICVEQFVASFKTIGYADRIVCLDNIPAKLYNKAYADTDLIASTINTLRWPMPNGREIHINLKLFTMACCPVKPGAIQLMWYVVLVRRTYLLNEPSTDTVWWYFGVKAEAVCCCTELKIWSYQWSPEFKRSTEIFYHSCNTFKRLHVLMTVRLYVGYRWECYVILLLLRKIFTSISILSRLI